jgi:hypothetical protein
MFMAIILDVPEDVARQLAADDGALARLALEALALEGVRSGKLTTAQARRLLSIPSRHQMDGFLKEHGVFLDTTFDDVMHDAETARRFSR